jgi:hypothetical protein
MESTCEHHPKVLLFKNGNIFQKQKKEFKKKLVQK